MNEILNKRIEEACIAGSKQYSDTSKYSKVGYIRGFNEGAEYALSHQWISVDKALPEDEDNVLCMMKSNHAIVNGYIFKENGISKVATKPDFHFEDYEDYEVIAWMPTPEFEPKK